MVFNVPTFFFLGVDLIKFGVTLGTSYALYLAVSLTLNLEAGYTGVPNFGKVMFLAGGAAVSAAVCGRLAVYFLGITVSGDYNGNIVKVINQVNAALATNPLLCVELILLGTVLAAGVGALIGFLASYPAIRLREDYLGMLLLAAAQFFQIFLGAYSPLIGGTQGLSVPNFFAWSGSGVGVRDVVILGFLATFALAVFIYVERIARSPLGRTLRAVRDNEVASRALGKNDVALRRNVIIIAAAISGIAGALLTFEVASVGSGTWDRITWTFWIWVMVIIGGSGNNYGVAAGAFSFTFLFNALDQVQIFFQPFLPSFLDVNFLRYILFASLLILILAFKPGGIIPEKSSPTLPRRILWTTMERETLKTESDNQST